MSLSTDMGALKGVVECGNFQPTSGGVSSAKSICGQEHAHTASGHGQSEFRYLLIEHLMCYIVNRFGQFQDNRSSPDTSKTLVSKRPFEDE